MKHGDCCKEGRISFFLPIISTHVCVCVCVCVCAAITGHWIREGAKQASERLNEEASTYVCMYVCSSLDRL